MTAGIGRGRSGALAFFLAATASLGAGCSERTSASGAASGTSTGTSSTATSARGVPSAREDTRFVRIRNLLAKDPEGRERATALYALVEPICRDAAERTAFVEVARWSASFSIGHDRLPTVLALDTLEHVATSCARNYPAEARELVERARVAIPDPHRHALILARLLAAEGKLAEAAVEADAAASAGSVHALALAANIEAQLARDAGVGYQPGMLDRAIARVSVEPTQAWSLIDLTAVLSTRAHLLTERAVWEEEPARSRTRGLALETYRRLSVAPFIEATRAQALDHLCFGSAPGSGAGQRADCRRAGEELGVLGGVVLAGLPRDTPRIDRERLAKLEQLARDLEGLGPASTVLVVARGDESELIAWALPAARLLGEISAKGARLVLLDRARSRRASALVDRVFAIAGAKATERLGGEGSGAFAMPCLAAISAGRRTPPTCPFDAKTIARLERSGPPTFALLVGRDLDAELDDLRLYGLKSVLLSFRQTRIEAGVDTWLKSLSDVWIVAPPAER